VTKAALKFSNFLSLNKKKIQKKNAQSLLNKVLAFEDKLKLIKDNTPLNVESFVTKTLSIKDSVKEALEKKSYQKIEHLERAQNELETELNNTLNEQLLLLHTEFASWKTKLKQMGIDTKTEINANIEKDSTTEQKNRLINQAWEAGQTLAKEATAFATQTYIMIQSHYDQELPEKNLTIEFATHRIEKKESPWLTIEAVCNALNNWKRQYEEQIQQSIASFQKAIEAITTQSQYPCEGTSSFRGEETQKSLDYYKTVEKIKNSNHIRLKKAELNIFDYFQFHYEVHNLLIILNEVLLALHKAVNTEEETIERLLINTENFWEKNSYMLKELQTATDNLSNPNYRVTQIMDDLPTYLSYVDEALKALSVYHERKEILLNYPLAKAAIEKNLKEKDKILPKDLPFNPQYGAEYLRLYYRERFENYTFKKEENTLTKR
jgi:hypothetical protein